MPKLTFDLDEIQEAMQDYIGFCIECGEERDCCEPDARNYECPYCEEFAVFGAEELLMMGLVK